jgi:hypothetical protein
LKEEWKNKNGIIISQGKYCSFWDDKNTIRNNFDHQR